MGAAAEQLSHRRPSTGWAAGVTPALAGWAAARVAVALGFALAHALSGQVWMPDGRLHLDEGLLTWDASYYRVLTEGWYGGVAAPPDATRFFPLYPGLSRLLDPLLPGGAGVPLLVVANVCALAAAVLVWKLASEVLGDDRTAVRAAWMLGVIPAANVFVFAYSEAAMMLVFTAALLALHRRRLGWLAVLGLLAGLLRPAGVLLAAPVAVGAWQWWRGRAARQPAFGSPLARTALEQPLHGQLVPEQPTREHPAPEHPAPEQPAAEQPAAEQQTPGQPAFARAALGWVAAVLAPVVGLAAALAWIAGLDGDWGEPFRRQRELRGGFRDPITRMFEAVVDLASGRLHDIYNMAFAFGFAALFWVALRRRQPLPWLAFMAVTWIVAVGGNNMDSVGRYCTVAAPFTIALAQWAEQRWQQIAIAAVGLAGTVWFTSEVMLGRMIP